MTFIASKIRCLTSKLNTICLAQTQVLQIRQSSYETSVFLEDAGLVKTKYDVTKNPDEWQFVERILPTTVVPTPIKKDYYVSGWTPQAENLQDKPYFVARNKNHLMPVYLQISQRGITRRTIIKKIQGDIWLLEKEIKEFLQEQTIKPIRSQVNEFAGYILINGDYVNAIKHWLTEKKF